MGHHLLVIVFTDESHAVEPVVLQHVHHAHEVTVKHVRVRPNEDPFLRRIAGLAQLFTQVVTQARQIGAEVLDEQTAVRLERDIDRLR